MSHNRNLKYLIQNRIVYRSDPKNDQPTEVYPWGYYFEDGTYECYSLFNSKAKITSYKSLKWHLLVLWYLNPQLDYDKFVNISNFIVDKSNGFTTFTPSADVISNITSDINKTDLEKPPKNRKRKVIFKDNTGLTTSEKLKIVGSIIGKHRKAEPEDIYDAMICVHELDQKITISKIAKFLNVTTRTIYRSITDDLNEIKAKLNNEKIQRSKL
ncbi:MAG: helix-turn-helix domain-containing protein, partial [Hellea sp.]